MLTIKALPSRNLDVRSFHLIKDGEPVGVIIEDRNVLARTVSNWSVMRIQGWNPVVYFDNCGVDEALAQAQDLAEDLFAWQPEHDRYYQRVITGYGRTLNYCVTDGEAHLANHQKELMDLNQGQQRLKDNHFMRFLERELLETGDWPVEIQVLNDRTHEVVKRRIVGEPG